MNPTMPIKNPAPPRSRRRSPLAATLVILVPFLAIPILSCDDDDDAGPTTTTHGDIQGTVTDAATLSPIASATIALLGTTTQAPTDTAGHYSLQAVAAGTQILQATASNYLAALDTITVTANATTTANFALELLPAAAGYYVSPSGSDLNDGSQSAPWRTIQHAADSAVPGDQIHLRAGTYAEAVNITTSGAPGAPVRIAAVAGETAIVESIEFARATAYHELDGFTVQDFGDWGIFLRGDNHHITLSNLTIIGGEASIHLTYGDSGTEPMEGPVTDITIEDCVTQDPEFTAIDCTPGPCNRLVLRRLEISGAGLVGQTSFGADGIAVERGEEILVEDCYVHDNGGDGIDLNSRDTAGNMTRIVVRRNRVVRNHQNGIKMWAGGRMENNVVWGQGNSAVWIATHPGVFEVINNTIAYNMWDPAYSGRNYAFSVAYPEEGPSAEADLTLVNNIFAFNCTAALGGATGLYLGEGVNLVDEGYNIFFSREGEEITANFVIGDPEFTRAEIGDGTWAAATGQGDGDIILDPLFTAGWPNVDLKLQEASPGVDQGTGIGAPVDDLLGFSRPRSGGYDIGAYER